MNSNRIARILSISVVFALTGCGLWHDIFGGGSSSSPSPVCLATPAVGNIGPFAGTAGSSIAYGGDGGLATAAELDGPSGLAVDYQSNVYIADTSNNRIRMVSSCGGTISTIAGSGSAAFGGDNGPATTAELDSPNAVAVSPSLDIYIADSGNNAVRFVSHTIGKITTIAGMPVVAGNSGDNSIASLALLSGPRGVAVDSVGNVYISDTFNNRVRKISPTGIITNYAGNSSGQAGFSGDGGLATQAKLTTPYQLAIAPNNDLYIADTGNSRIRKVSYATGVISTVAGNGIGAYNGDMIAATSAGLGLPFGVAVDSDYSLYIATASDFRVRKVTNNIISTIVGNGMRGSSGESGPATAANLTFPSAVAVDSNNRLYLNDNSLNVILTVTQ